MSHTTHRTRRIHASDILMVLAGAAFFAVSISVMLLAA
jgi:hypothetical protein